MATCSSTTPHSTTLHPPGPLALVGAGGHARVVIDAALASGWAIAACWDDNPSPNPLPGLPLHESAGKLFDAFQQTPSPSNHNLPPLLHISVGDLSLRAMLIAAAIRHAVPITRFATIIHPRAAVSPYAHLEPGVLVAALAAINPCATIGRHAIINTAAVVEHDCTLAENVHIAPRATLCGNVTVGPDTLIGAGAIVLPGLTIGQRCTVAAGAVVTANVPDNATVVGAPARATLPPNHH